MIADQAGGAIRSGARPEFGELRDETACISTNDVASIDANGHLIIFGRLGDVIVRGGFKIDPTELHGALLEHPAVRGGAIVAALDEPLGQGSVAGVELGTCGEFAEQELRDWVRARLSPCKES
jgi:long-chain acyl-CoA synthetase